MLHGFGCRYTVDEASWSLSCERWNGFLGRVQGRAW